jgi:hypothetical protein
VSSFLRFGFQLGPRLGLRCDDRLLLTRLASISFSDFLLLSGLTVAIDPRGDIARSRSSSFSSMITSLSYSRSLSSSPLFSVLSDIVSALCQPRSAIPPLLAKNLGPPQLIQSFLVKIGLACCRMRWHGASECRLDLGAFTQCCQMATVCVHEMWSTGRMMHMIVFCGTPVF